MKIYLPANAIIVPIVRHERTHYFFLDSGMPYSFSNDLDAISHIDHLDVGCQREFRLPLKQAPIDTAELSAHLMLEIAGFLGMDFLHQFNRVEIDFVDKRLTFDDVETFEADHRLPLIRDNPLMTMLSIDSIDSYQPALIDTGCWISLMIRAQTLSHPKSPGWLMPSAFGPMNIDFYAGVDIFAQDGVALGSYVVGKPLNLPSLGFDVVLGLNVLSRYRCLFDLREGVLALKAHHDTTSCRATLDGDLHGPGIQVVRRGRKIIVSNVLPDFMHQGLAVGDEIVLDDLDWDDPELINEVFCRLHSHGASVEIPLLGDRRTQPLFTEEVV